MRLLWFCIFNSVICFFTVKLSGVFYPKSYFVALGVSVAFLAGYLYGGGDRD